MPESNSGQLLQLLAPFPGRLEFAIRLSVICALTTLVTAIYRTPDPALTVYVVFFMNKPDRTTSLILNLALVIVITVVIGTVFLLARAVIDEPFWRVTSIAMVSFALLFLASASKLQPIASTLALIVAYALDLLGSAPTGEFATRALLYAWLFVGIPAGVSIVVNLLLAPSPRRLAERALAERLHLAAAMLRRPDEKVRKTFRATMYEGTAELSKSVKLAGVERTSPAADIAALEKAIRSTTAILLLIDMIDRDAIQIPDAARQEIASTLTGMAGILHNGGYPVEIELEVSDLAQIHDPLPAKILGYLKAAVEGFAEPITESQTPAGKKEGGFFVPDAFSNPEHVRYSLKATAAAMTCYLLYSLLNWPGIHTSFLTCYIVSLGTTAETIEKLSLRIMGCLLGAAVGIGTIVFILPHLTSIGSLMALVFIGTLAAGWVAAGSPRISYAGFQIAFAFFLCVIQGAKPGFDLVVARDRVIGILLGNIVVYLIFTNVWPVSVKQRIDGAVEALLRGIARMTSTGNTAMRLVLASENQGSLGAIKQNLLIASYEPVEVRPGPEWLDRRQEAMRCVEELIGPLFIAPDIDMPYATGKAHRLDLMADDLAPASSARESSETAGTTDDRQTTTPDAAAADLRNKSDMQLKRLEDLLAPSAPENRTVQYASA